MTEAMSQNAYAKRCGVSVSYINQLVKAGSIPLLAGKVDVAAADEFMASRPRTEAPSKAKKAKGKLDGAQERARLAKEKADAQAIENAKARGLLIERSGVREKVEQQYGSVRQKLLSIPNKAAPQVIGLEAKEAAGFIRALIVEALDELSADAAVETEDAPDFLSRRESA